MHARESGAKVERHRLPTLLQPANSTGPAAGNVVTLAERVKPPR